MTAIELLNHELLLRNQHNLEVVVSIDGNGFDLYDRFTGEHLDSFEDEAEAMYGLNFYKP